MSHAIETPPVERPKATLTTLGNRIVPSDGRFHPYLAAQYVIDRPGQWIATGELAKCFYGSNTDSNRRRIRHNMFRILHAVLDASHFLLLETDRRKGHQRCKIYDPRAREERQLATEQIDRMERQKVLKAERLQKARSLVECVEAAAEDLNGLSTASL